MRIVYVCPVRSVLIESFCSSRIDAEDLMGQPVKNEKKYGQSYSLSKNVLNFSLRDKSTTFGR